MRDFHKGNSNQYSKPYFEGFALSLFIVWSPFKLLAYLTPFLFVIWFILRSNSGRTLIKCIRVIGLFGLTLLFYEGLYFFFKEKFILQNTFLSFLTYGSFIIFLVIPKSIYSHALHKRYFSLIRFFLILESVVGIAQLVISILLNGLSFDLAAGDVVQGTLNPLSFINPGGNFNNQIYTYNLLLLLIIYAPYAIHKRKDFWICGLALAAVFFAAVWHLLLAFLAAIALVSLIFYQQTRKISTKRVLVMAILFLGLSLSALVQPKNFSLISHYYIKIATLESPKAKTIEKSILELPADYPFVYLTGLGPGQYSSRAGLIGTGKYFGEFDNPRQLPLLKPKSHKAFDEYVYPAWKDVATHPETFGNSTMSRPFFSVLSFLIEFGLLTFSILFFLASIILWKLRKKKMFFAKKKQRLKEFIIFSIALAIVYLALTGLFENYWEVAHAIFIGVLLIKYSFSYLYEEEENIGDHLRLGDEF